MIRCFLLHCFAKACATRHGPPRRDNTTRHGPARFNTDRTSTNTDCDDPRRPGTNQTFWVNWCRQSSNNWFGESWTRPEIRKTWKWWVFKFSQKCNRKVTNPEWSRIIIRSFRATLYVQERAAWVHGSWSRKPPQNRVLVHGSGLAWGDSKKSPKGPISSRKQY